MGIVPRSGLVVARHEVLRFLRRLLFLIAAVTLLVLGGAAAFVVSCATVFALGMALASVVASARSAQAVGMTVFYPMIFLSGAAIPRALLPAGVQRAAAVLPLTHVVTLLQAAWNGDALTADPWTIVALGLTTSVASTVAVWSFRWE